jgi:hypothetical protein
MGRRRGSERCKGEKERGGRSSFLFPCPNDRMKVSPKRMEAQSWG